MMMEGLEALLDRARDTLATALTHRSRPADKSQPTPPSGTTAKSDPEHTRDGSSAFYSSAPEREARPDTHVEASMRGHYEGVPMQEYLAVSPHTVGVPVPDVHPSTTCRPPIHPRGQERLGIPQQQRPPRNHMSATIGCHPRHLARPSAAYPRHRDLYGGNNDRHMGYLHYDYGGSGPFASQGVGSMTTPSVESLPSERSFHSGHSSSRSRSDRRRVNDCRVSTLSRHRPRRTLDDRGGGEGGRRRRRSYSPPAGRRSRSRESERSRREISGRALGSNGRELGTAAGVVNSGFGRSVPGVYTISDGDLEEPPHQEAQFQHVQPPSRQEQETSAPLKWRVAVRRALAEHDLEPIKPLLPTTEEFIDFFGRSQVIALVCGIITAFLMVLALSSSDWLLAVGWRQGLFAHCVGNGSPKPLPFQISAEVGCHTARDEPYIMASAALCVICLLLDVFATFMTGLGLSSNDPAVKTRYYRIAVWVMTVALIAILIALILYPVFFAQELELGNRSVWEFGWAYGVGWGAAIFLFGAVVLLLCDQEEEEIYYKERTIIHAENDSRA